MIVPWILTFVGMALSMDHIVLVVNKILGIDTCHSFLAHLSLHLIASFISISGGLATIYVLLVVAYLSISGGIIIADLLHDITTSVDTAQEQPSLLFTVFQKYNVVVIILSLIYLVQLCGTVALGCGSVIIVLMIFLSVKAFGKVALIFYFLFPFAVIIGMTALQIVLKVTQSVNDSSLTIKRKLRQNCSRRNGYAAKKIRALQEVKFILSIAKYTLCGLKRSTKSTMNGHILNYSLDLLLTVPANSRSVNDFFVG